MATKKQRGRPAKPDAWANMCVRIPADMVDALDNERKKLLLSDRSTLVRQIIARHLQAEETRAAA